MDRVDNYTLYHIFSYAYDLDDYNTYAKLMWQLGHLNKFFKCWTRRRDFLEAFYFYMFPKNTIPSTSLHIENNCDGRHYYSRMDQHGYMYQQQWYPRVDRKISRCKIPSHYDVVDARNSKSRYKNMYMRCRSKYINVKLKENPFSQYQQNRLNFKKQQLDALKREYNDILQVKRKRARYLALKNGN